jgi:hypothetical protein
LVVVAWKLLGFLALDTFQQTFCLKQRWRDGGSGIECAMTSSAEFAGARTSMPK